MPQTVQVSAGKAPARLRNRRSWACRGLVAAALPMALVIGACGTKSGSTAASSSGQVNAFKAECGAMPGAAPKDPDGVVAKLPAVAQASYTDYPYEVKASPWATLADAGPVKIGYSGLAPINSVAQGFLDTTNADAAAAQQQGLIDGPMLTEILADAATQTPAEQIRGYQSLVRQGAKAIIINALSGEAMAPAVTEAGKQGVVTVTIMTYIPSDYAINVLINPLEQGLQPAATMLKNIAGKGNVLMVRGFQGDSTDTLVNDGFHALLANCPDVKLLGEAVGNYSPAAAKTAVLQFLASHPQQIDGVAQPGVMTAGIMGAFIQAGRPMPSVGDSGASPGSLAYWLDHQAAGYKGSGTAGNGNQLADASFRVMMRALSGKGPKVTSVVVPALLITPENLTQYATAGANLNDPGALPGKPQDLASDAFLNNFFTTAGSAGSNS
jgi:ribose transport system substrate-binding protein